MPHETGIPTPELSYLRDAPIRCMPLLPASVPHMCTFLPLPGPTFCPQARSEKSRRKIPEEHCHYGAKSETDEGIK